MSPSSDVNNVHLNSHFLLHKEDVIRISLISEHRLFGMNKVFSIPRTSSFVYLKQKISQCTGLQLDQFNILWQDEDGDRIEIDGDEEWSHALSFKDQEPTKHFVLILQEGCILSPVARIHSAPTPAAPSNIQDLPPRCSSLGVPSKRFLNPLPAVPPPRGPPRQRQFSVDMHSPCISSVLERPRAVSNCINMKSPGLTPALRKPVMSWLPSSPGCASTYLGDGRRAKVESKGLVARSPLDRVACLQRMPADLDIFAGKEIREVHPETSPQGAEGLALPRSPGGDFSPLWKRVEVPNGRSRYVQNKPFQAGTGAALESPTLTAKEVHSFLQTLAAVPTPDPNAVTIVVQSPTAKEALSDLQDDEESTLEADGEEAHLTTETSVGNEEQSVGEMSNYVAEVATGNEKSSQMDAGTKDDAGWGGIAPFKSLDDLCMVRKATALCANKDVTAGVPVEPSGCEQSSPKASQQHLPVPEVCGTCVAASNLKECRLFAAQQQQTALVRKGAHGDAKCCASEGSGARCVAISHSTDSVKAILSNRIKERDAEQFDGMPLSASIDTVKAMIRHSPNRFGRPTGCKEHFPQSKSVDVPKAAKWQGELPTSGRKKRYRIHVLSSAGNPHAYTRDRSSTNPVKQVEETHGSSQCSARPERRASPLHDKEDGKGHLRAFWLLWTNVPIVLTFAALFTIFSKWYCDALSEFTPAVCLPAYGLPSPMDYATLFICWLCLGLAALGGWSLYIDTLAHHFDTGHRVPPTKPMNQSRSRR